jgi:hypothetical protein
MSLDMKHPIQSDSLDPKKDDCDERESTIYHTDQCLDKSIPQINIIRQSNNMLQVLGRSPPTIKRSSTPESLSLIIKRVDDMPTLSQMKPTPVTIRRSLSTSRRSPPMMKLSSLTGSMSKS